MQIKSRHLLGPQDVRPVIAVFVGLLGAPLVAAQTFTDFEASGFVDGETIDNHRSDGTNPSPAISSSNLSPQAWFMPGADPGNVPPDEEIVDLASSVLLLDQQQAAAHGKVWRLSQGTATGRLGDAPASPHMNMVAGETGALNDAGRGAPTTNVFRSQFDFRSATGAGQAGLSLAAYAGAFDQRHSYLRISDDGSSGFDLVFFDTVGNNFQSTTFDLDLSYTDWHTIDIETTFVDGFASGDFGDNDAVGNDVTRIFVNGNLIHTGTSWESFYAFQGNHAEAVDLIQFSGESTVIPSQLEGGLYFDNVMVTNQAVPEPATAGLLLAAGLPLIARRRRRSA
jgi:hypothetical protein